MNTTEMNTTEMYKAALIKMSDDRRAGDENTEALDIRPLLEYATPAQIEQLFFMSIEE